MQNAKYIQALSDNQQVARLGEIDDPNTLLTLNMPDIKAEVTSAATQEFEKLPAPYNQQASDQFKANQAEFASKVTHAFSDSLQKIFIVASAMIGMSAVLVFTLKEKKLRSASPDATPGEA